MSDVNEKYHGKWRNPCSRGTRGSYDCTKKVEGVLPPPDSVTTAWHIREAGNCLRVVMNVTGAKVIYVSLEILRGESAWTYVPNTVMGFGGRESEALEFARRLRLADWHRFLSDDDYAYLVDRAGAGWKGPPA